MNIYDYFYSKDIADHCQKINHTFSPLDMAIIVFTGDKTIQEKHNAYRQIIDENPDVPIPLRHAPIDSLHGYLRELIAYEEEAIAAITASDNGAAFKVEIHHKDYNDEPDCITLDGIYTTFDRAKQGFCNAKWDWAADKVKRLTIKKVYIDMEDEVCYKREVSLNQNYEIVDVAFQREEGNDFDCNLLDTLFYDLPIPFKEGDIVTIWDNKPYVIAKFLWENKHNTYEDYVNQKTGDNGDMSANMYFFQDGVFVLDWPYPIDRMQYYKGKLEGEERFLKYLSEYIKKDLKCLEWIISVYMKFHMQEESEKWSRLFSECSGEEMLLSF